MLLLVSDNRDEGSISMEFFKQLFGGLLGGALGAIIWATIVQVTGYEIGIAAWLVGILVGLGVVVSSGRRGVESGVLAAFVAFIAIGAGKASTVWIEMDDYRRQALSDDSMVALIADDVLIEHEDAGVDYSDWYASAEYDEDAEIAAWYPPEVWAAADREWHAMSGAEQDEMRSEVNADIDAFAPIAIIVGTLISLGLFDFLWVFLAVGSAYKIASDHAGGVEQQHAFGVKDAGMTTAEDAPTPAQGGSVPGGQTTSTVTPTHPMLRMGMQQADAAASRPPMRRLSDPAPESDQAEAA